MAIMDANRRTNEEHDFYQTLPCQIKCLCQYLDLNKKRVLDAGAGMQVISKNIKKIFPKVKIETSEINSNHPDSNVLEFNFFFTKQLAYIAERDYGIKPVIVNTNQFPISNHGDFFKVRSRYDYIISNPPYSLKDEFIEYALEIADHVFMLFPLQVLNYIEFCEKWLDNDSYCGRILMYPKVILNPEGEYIQGGNTGYAWFHWSGLPSEEKSNTKEKYEVIEDIRKYK
jgi:hypothetical protein